MTRQSLTFVSMLLPFLGALSACRGDYKLAEVPSEPLTVTVLTPTYGAYLGSHSGSPAPDVAVTGVVTPPDAQVLVNGVHATVDAEGNFSATVPWALDSDPNDRAFVLDVKAWDPDESARELVPVFDGLDPRDTDPGAVNGLLTPSGLDALEPVVADTVDALGLWDQLAAALPAVDTDYVDITPLGITSSGTSADLAPAADAITLLLTFDDVVMTADVGILNTYTFPVEIGLGEVSFGANAQPGLSADDMLTLALTDAQADINDVSLSFGDYDVPDWITQLLVDPLAGLIADLGGGLVTAVLDQLGSIELGGPFAFDTDFGGTSLSVRLAEVAADPNGVNLGITVSTDGDAAVDMPDLTPLTAQTPSGLDYQLGFALHEGLFNTLIDDTVAGFLDIDLELEGDYGELLGAGIAALPGGWAIPDDHEGYCIGFHAGEARVVRLAAGNGAPMAQLWLPDMRVAIQTIQDGSCTDWLDASVFAVVDINLEGTSLNLDFDVKRAIVLEYRAYDEDTSIDLDDVGTKLGAVVEGFAALALNQASFDLGDMLGGLGGLGISLNPEIVSVEPLAEEGRYGLYLNVF
jgi:hypothetical protein